VAGRWAAASSFSFAGAFYMTANDFGIYGLIASGSYVFAQIAGMEAYQTIMRRISQAGTEAFIPDRPFYARMMVFTGTIAFATGAGLGLWFGWSQPVVLLCAGIVLSEYLGVEAMRVLIAERHYNASMAAVSMRFLPWSVGFPLLRLAGVLKGNWPIEQVLAAWLVFSFVAMAFTIPILPRYLCRAPAGFRAWFIGILRSAPPWVVIALSARFIESGTRMVPGFLIDEAAAGRFVFLASIASLGAVAMKSAIEPLYFTRMIVAEEGSRARRQFALVNLAVLGAFAAVALAA
jgi:hypothetical protein